MPIPREITAVQGCTCTGSLEVHLFDCALRMLPEQQYRARVDATRTRLNSWMTNQARPDGSGG